MNVNVFKVAAALLCCPNVTAYSANLPKQEEKQAKSVPNIVLIMCDDLGYGDLSCYGHPTIMTPNIDRMAAEGMKCTQFYTGASVSTPSRAAILTGRYPIHNGMYGDEYDVLSPHSTAGLPATEVTMAQMLKDDGYTTACIGKWHLGHIDGFLPNDHGFEYYFGIPYSNDMCTNREHYEVPIMENKKVIEMRSDLSTLTDDYTKKAVEFIERNKKNKFFLYMPHTFPHTPLYASAQSKGKSKRGLYGDVMMDLDRSVGAVLKCLRDNGLDEKTLVIFTSDNGPWLVRRVHGGNAALFTEGKATTWEGGLRVPCIMRWPGVICPASISQSLCSAIDFLPTFAALTGAKLPDCQLDGYDISAQLRNPEAVVRNVYYYYHGSKLFGIRKGKWKLHIHTSSNPYPKTERIDHWNDIRLYDIENDPSEKFDHSKKYPGIVAELTKELKKWEEANPPVPSVNDHCFNKPE